MLQSVHQRAGRKPFIEVVRRFHQDIPGTVIVQHMPPGFTKMYAERLNNQCRVVVREAKTGDRVVPGQVLITPEMPICGC